MMVGWIGGHARVVVVAGLIAGPVGSAVAQERSSLWDTDFGMLKLTVAADGMVSGAYPDYQGRFIGALDTGTRVISGFWLQPQSEVKCATQKAGTYFWGRVAWEVSSETELFGRWSYCDQPEGSSGVWEAWLEGGVPPLAAVTATTPGKPTPTTKAAAPPPPAKADNPKSVSAKGDAGVSDGQVWEASRFLWGTSVIQDNLFTLRGDLTCDGKEDVFLGYLDLDNPEGQGIAATVIRPGDDLEMLPYQTLSFGGDGQDSFCGEARLVDAQVAEVHPDDAMALTGFGPPLCNRGVRLDDGMCDAIWLFTMPYEEGMISIKLGRN